jgi:hypothetical protein
MKKQTVFAALALTIVLIAGCSANSSHTASHATNAKPQTTKPVTSSAPASQTETQSQWVTNEIQLFQNMESDFNTYNQLLNDPKNTTQWLNDTHQATLQVEADIQMLQQHKPIEQNTSRIYNSMKAALATAQKAMTQTELALRTEKIADIQKVDEYLSQAAAQLNKANSEVTPLQKKILNK